MSRAGPAWTPPAEFEEFRLVRYLGGGGMGHVWLAHDLLLDRPVAVKFLGDSSAASATEHVLAEARAAARLSHPNVAAVFRVGQLAQRPYIISEFVRGESLDRLPRPLPPRRVVELALGLCRGLMAAHHRGVLHRDLKPHNAIVDDAGEVKLVDFGLAKLLDGAAPAPFVMAAPSRPARADEPALSATRELSRPPGDVVAFASLPPVTRLAGTPLYMAPEIWRGEPATVRSDLYSLGALLYELCAGQAPFAGTPLSELPEAVATRAPVPLASRAPAIDARLAELVDRCLAAVAAERPASADDIYEALSAIAGGEASAIVAAPDGNPYRGLLPFEAEHRALFFGRGRDVRAVVERLRGERLVVITGDSGAGKSSLCRAGVLSALAGGTLRDGRRWATAALLPGRRPLRALGAALAPFCDGDDEALARALAAEPDGVARQLHARLGRDGGLVLLVDQLEELATEATPDEAAAFGAALGALVDATAALRVLAAVRGDFLGRVATASGLRDRLARALYLLAPLDEAATREAIVGPARLTGVRFESDALVDELARATVAAQGGLPLLQFALAELWESRDRTRGLITRAALDGLGGLGGALGRHGDRVLGALLPAERQAARRALLRLVTVDGTRARRSAAELGDDEAAIAAVEALVRGRLIVAREDDGRAAYELAHEALVDGWATLRDWIAELGSERAARDRLAAAAAEWERLGGVADALWSARRLDEIARLPPGELSALERRFLAASRRAVGRQRRRRIALALALPLAVAAAVAAVHVSARHRVASEVAARLAAADGAERAARAAASEADTRARAAFAAFDGGRNDDGESAWREARAAAAVADADWGRAAAALEAALSLDGARDDLRSRFADVLLIRALAAERAGRVAERDELLARLSLYDSDGSRAARFAAPGRLVLTSTPAATATVSAYERRADGLRLPGPPRALGATPVDVKLPPGSYLLLLAAPGHATVRWPFVLGRGETLSPSLPLPPLAAVPDGFVYVPPGRFLYGTLDEAQRSFDLTAPLHPRTTGAFYIARHETTFAEWIAFLDALPPAERARHVPRGAGNLHGAARLEGGPGAWRLVLEPSEVEYKARLGEPLVYRDRDRRASQDWTRFPVVGVDWADVEAYARWLDVTGRVRGARACGEDEWERAARGADEREFPHGDRLRPEDADFDETYGKRPAAFGPDEVGAHPASASPFGAEDMTGNVWEWTRGSGVPAGSQVLRSGAYYYGAITGRVANRQIVESGMRDATLGVRICADVRQ